MDGDDSTWRIPPGVRFMPTDEELLKYYLMPKLIGRRPPCEAVREAEVYEHHPQDLLGTDHMAYFFTSRNRKYPNGKRPDRKAGDGFWKASSCNKGIKIPNSSVIGYKRMLAYHMNVGTSKGRKTNWLMAEYTIPFSQLPLQEKKLDTWVLCKLYMHNREKDQDGSRDISEDQAVGSLPHFVDHEDVNGPTEIDNLLQDMVMPNYMPLQPVAQITQDGFSSLDSTPLDSQPSVDLPSLPSLFTGYVEAGPSTSYANAAMLISTPSPDFFTTLPEAFNSELLDISRNYTPPTQKECCNPSEHCQGHPNSQPLVTLPSPPSPFTKCVEAAPSTSHAGAIERTSTPPPDFSILPQISNLDWQNIFGIIEGKHAPLQSVPQTTQRGNSRLNQGSLDSQPPIALPSPPSPFTGYAEAEPSTFYTSAAVSISASPPNFSATLPGSFDSRLSEKSEDLQGNDVPLQSIAQRTQYDPSRLS